MRYPLQWAVFLISVVACSSSVNATILICTMKFPNMAAWTETYDTEEPGWVTSDTEYSKKWALKNETMTLSIDRYSGVIEITFPRGQAEGKCEAVKKGDQKF